LFLQIPDLFQQTAVSDFLGGFVKNVNSCGLFQGGWEEGFSRKEEEKMEVGV
jgi:hypothetical protein